MLAPEVTRQRLLVEGYYGKPVDEQVIRDYFTTIASSLGLRTYGEPIIHSPSGEGKEENQGYDAFVPLIDSGISLYVWTQAKFFSVVLYTCKAFDANEATRVTSQFFQVGEIESKAF